MEVLQEIITAARNIRAEIKADPTPATRRRALFSDRRSGLARCHLDVIQKLANLKLDVRAGAAPRGEGGLRSTPEFDLVLHLPPAEAGAQRKRIDKQIEQLEKVIASSRRQLEDEEFLSRAPARVVDSIRGKLADYEAQLAKSRASLEGLPES